jgi:hypothetical protein
MTLTVLQDFFLLLGVPTIGGQTVRGCDLQDGVVRRTEKASVVTQHKQVVRHPEPGDDDSGHGSFEGGRARTFES